MTNELLSVTFDYSDVKKYAFDLNALGDRYFPMALENAVTEASLFFEGEAKRHAPVDSGRLKASIGRGEDGIWSETFAKGLGYWIDIGTNVEYAPYMEFGFTMSTGHVAFIQKAGGFRYVHPFSFLGYHYMQKAASSTEAMLNMTIQKHIDLILTQAGF